MKRQRDSIEEDDGPVAKVARRDDAPADGWLPPDAWREVATYLPEWRDWRTLAQLSAEIRDAVYSLRELRRRLPADWRDREDGDGLYTSDALGIPWVLGVRAPDADARLLEAIDQTAVARELWTYFRADSETPLLVAGGAARAALLDALRGWAPTPPAAQLLATYDDIDIWISVYEIFTTLGALIQRPVVLRGDSPATIKLGRLNIVPWATTKPRAEVEAHVHRPGGERSPICCFDMACCQIGIRFARGRATGVVWRLDALCSLYTRDVRLRNWHGNLGPSTYTITPFIDRYPFNGKPTMSHFDPMLELTLRSPPMVRFVRRLLAYAARGHCFSDLGAAKAFCTIPDERDRIAFLATFLWRTRIYHGRRAQSIALDDSYAGFFADTEQALAWMTYLKAYNTDSSLVLQ